MRFRTTITNVGLLHKIVRSLASLARQCTIRLSAEKVHFIVPGNEGRDGVQVWSQVSVLTLFSNFRIESNNDNEIWLEINLEALAKILRSADNSVGVVADSNRGNATSLNEADVTLKLNKKGNQPLWVFDIRGVTSAGKRMSITHEVNVLILGKRRQDELNEPLCPPPDIHLLLPPLPELRNIVARLSHIADDVKLSANLEGTMELSVGGSQLDLSTTWKNLHIPISTTDTDAERPPATQMFSTTVTIKGLLKFLNSHVVGGQSIACICERHCIIAYVYIGEISSARGVLTFFIPAKNVGDD